MRLSDYPVVFTKDGNYFFSCNGRSIRIISVETGQVVRVLSSSIEEGGHSDKVTSLVLNPRNPLQLYSASADGTIKLWDFNDAILLKTHEVGVPITHMVMHENQPDTAYLTTTKRSRRSASVFLAKKTGGLIVKENSVLLRFSLKSNVNKPVLRLLKGRVFSGLTISSDGQYLVIASRFKLHVVNIATGSDADLGALDEKDPTRFRTYLTTESLTCVAFHPAEGCIAAGDERGRITLWYCFGKNVESPVTTTMHWHAHRVASMAFSADGTYLLSGGEESTLVIWQLNTGFKQFLPRLGSEIKHITISPDQAYYAVGLRDNSVSVIRSVDLQTKTVIQGLKFSHVNHQYNPLSTGLVIEPRNGNVVLNGLPGTIQFFDPIREQHIMEMEISPRNKTSRTEDKEIIPPRVMHVAFSNDKAARWMVTVDGRDDHETTPELYLKFWEYDDDQRTYVLNTRVDSPHAKEVTSCVFNPRQGNQAPMVVTTSLDGTFKVWELTHQGDARRGIEAERAWNCRSTGFYRDSIPHCAGFSSDGSLLAVAYGQIITLWNPYLNTLQGVLTQPPENRPVKHLAFLKNSPFLVATTKDHLYCWNLLTCSVWWSYKIKIDGLVASQTNNQFMIICSDFTPEAPSQQRIVVFKPSSPVPVRIETKNKKIRGATFMQDPALSIKSGADAVEPILMMSHGYDLEILGGRSAEELKAEAEEAEKKAREIALAAERQKNFVSDIFGLSAERNAAAEAKEAAAIKRESASSSLSKKSSKKNATARHPLFDAPSHVMAPVTSLFEAFMEPLLLENKAAKEEAKERKRLAKLERQLQSKAGKEDKDEDESEEGSGTKDAEDVEMDDTVEDVNEEKAVATTQLSASLSKFFSSRLNL
ncbi:hypothetical protein BGZ83_008059 [Gryganskiella cystojenkinii]|nr:hypothetical protein BGZ83_008059 [Gryganskiella cystojenkinii]